MSPKIIKGLEAPIFAEYARVVVVPFVSKNCPPSFQEKFARAYMNSLMAKKLFGAVWFMSQHYLRMEEASLRAREEGKDFLLYGRIDRLLATGGGQPQGVRLEIWVVNVRNDSVVFHVVQEGYSVPGRDIDLYWKTHVGRAGAGVEHIVRALADQFAEVLSAAEGQARKEMSKRLKEFRIPAE